MPEGVRHIHRVTTYYHYLLLVLFDELKFSRSTPLFVHCGPTVIIVIQHHLLTVFLTLSSNFHMLATLSRLNTIKYHLDYDNVMPDAQEQLQPRFETLQLHAGYVWSPAWNFVTRIIPVIAPISRDTIAKLKRYLIDPADMNQIRRRTPERCLFMRQLCALPPSPAKYLLKLGMTVLCLQWLCARCEAVWP